MIDFVKIDHAFAAPLTYIKVDNHLRLNDLLQKEAYDWKRTEEGNQKSNKHGWQSSETLLEKKTAGFKWFADLIPNCTALTVSKINPKIDINNYTFKANAWVNINPKDGYNAIHHHGKFHFSGVYYVKTPKEEKKNGRIEFINSRNDYNISKDIEGSAFATSIRVSPKEGYMIVFPSSLLHTVHPNTSNEDRISIAWNILLVKKN